MKDFPENIEPIKKDFLDDKKIIKNYIKDNISSDMILNDIVVIENHYNEIVLDFVGEATSPVHELSASMAG
jgi:hypothetical protein